MEFKVYSKYLLILFFFLLFCLFLSGKKAHCEESLTETDVSNLIYWLSIDYGKGTEETTIVADRDTFASAFISASKRFGIPVITLLVRSFRESHFAKSVFTLERKGGNGEKGILQTNDEAIEYCAEHCGEMETAKEQVDCGACWFRQGQDWCKGNVYSGISAYITGKCNPRTNRQHEKVSRHFATEERIYKRIRKGIPIPPETIVN